MRTSSMTFRATTILFLLAALGYLYRFLFIVPFLPVENNGIADSLLYLAPGQRMLEGDLIYRDVFEYLTPGTALVNFFMFKLFGLRLWIPDLLALLLGLGIIWLGVVISRKMMRPGLTLLPSALFLVSRRAFLLDPTHHWYSVLAAMAAIAVLMERRTAARIVAAGLFCGLCACFTQTRGFAVVLGFAFYLWWESGQKREGWRALLRKESWLLCSCLVTFLAVNAHFIWNAGLARYLWCTIAFPLKYYPKGGSWNTIQALTTEFPAYDSLRTFLHPFGLWLSLFVTVPLLILLFFVHYWRGLNKKPVDYWERPMLVAIVGLFMLLGIAPAPDSVRMAMSGLPAFILLGWFLDSQHRVARALAMGLTLGALIVAIDCMATREPVLAGVLATPQGKVAFTDAALCEKYTWIQQHTRPSQYFYEAGYAEVYFYLDLRNPTPLSEIQDTGYTTPAQITEVIHGLGLHQVQFILWESGNLGTLPGSARSSEDNIGPLWDYVQSNYTRVKVFQDSDEIWERKVE